MKFIGFILFLAGIIFGLWWVSVLGLIIYEATGVTWIAATTVNYGDKDIPVDHGP